MKRITVRNLSVQFDADQETTGTDQEQAAQALELINLALQRAPYGLAAQVFSLDQLDVEADEMENIP